MGTTRTNGATKFGEIGESVAGNAYYGYIDKSYLPALRWPGVAERYDELWRSDPETTITRTLFASLTGKTTPRWELPTEIGNTELPPPNDADKRALDFVWSIADDIEGDLMTWLTDCNTKSPFYGFGLWEMVPGVRRKGWKAGNDDPWQSEADDGLTGIRRLTFLDYATFGKWVLSDSGRVLGWEQNTTKKGTVTIPADRLLHIRYGDLSNPEGIATLEAMHRLAYYQRNLEQIAVMGMERSAGILKVNAEEKLSEADKIHIRNMARAVMSAHEGNYMAWPKGMDGNIVDTPFAASATLLEMIRHYSLLKLALYGMQFVGIAGMSGTGSYAALNDSSSLAILMFNSMVEGFAKQAGEQITRQLFRWNAMAFSGISRMPVLKISPVAKTVSLTELSQFAQAMKAIMPLGDDDYIAIRKRSEILSETLPQVEEVATPEPQPDAAATDELPTDDAMGNELPMPEDDGAEMAQSDKVKPKGKPITVTGSTVTPTDINRAVQKFETWAKKNAPQLSDLLEAEVPESTNES